MQIAESGEEIEHLHLLGERHQKSCFSGKRLLIGLAIVTVCALALGLGLGLGLDNDGDDIKGGNGGEMRAECPQFPGINRAQQSVEGSTGERWLEQECSFDQEPTCDQSFQDNPPLLLISLDGYRAEYVHRNLTPSIQKLSDCGVKVPHMRPAFPTKTFPNHYTIATGLYPESHGIIDNFMYDTIIKETFTLSGASSKDNRWWFGEPIWNTAMKAGKRVHAFFWPGTEVDIQGMRPDICYAYEHDLPFEDRVDTVLSWLDLDASERPDLITLYFHEPDSAGHTHGPLSPGIEGALVEIDGVIGKLMDGLVDRQIDKCVNILIMSDHGMTEVNYQRRVDLQPMLDADQLFVYDGPVGRVTGRYRFGDDGDIEEVENPEPAESIMTRLQCGLYNTTADWYMRAFLKEDLPTRLHYARSDRIEEIILMAEDKWQVSTDMGFFTSEGNHGFDNIVENMQSFFAGYGPSLKANFEAEPFEVIELYNLMTQLLKVEDLRADNNGTLGSLTHFLSDSGSQIPTYPPPAGDYDVCEFPSDEEAQLRRNNSDCTCENIQNLTSTPVEVLDKQLDLSSTEVTDSEQRHLLPLGKPGIDLTDTSLCQLTQTDYITGYSHGHHMPLWTAYTMQRSGDISDHVSEDTLEDCARIDVRLPLEGGAKCSDYIDASQEISYAFMYPPSFTMTLPSETDRQLDAYISSNIVPMYQQFRKGVWREAMGLVEEYAGKYGHIQVISGPVFDYNGDGLGDNLQELTQFVGEGPVPIPSHFFITLARCPNGGDLYTCGASLDTMSVVIPHKPVLPNCWSLQQLGAFRYMQDNVARMKDVEHLTGLRLAEQPIDSTRVRLLTYLSIGLWERISWADSFGANEECPDLQRTQCPSEYDEDHPPIILISLDGFRPDYLERNVSPTLSTLKRCGVSAPYMKSVFPTLTFPNHYSVATGLYPESHGIVENSMFDLVLNESFFLSSPTVMNPKWWGGEPIWNTVEKAGKHAMAMMWVGADVPIQNMHITDTYTYNGDIPHSFRIDQVLEWLDGSKGVLPSLITLYFSSIDSAGHDGGHQSLQVTEAIEDVDKHLKSLMDGLHRMGMDKCANILITSDHGMSDISCDRNVLLNDYLGDEIMDKVCLYDGPTGRISNKYTCEFFNYVPVPEDQKVSPDEMVHRMSCQSPEMTVYTTPEMPVRHHYVNNPRIEEVQTLPRDSWIVQDDEVYCGLQANHGWDPNYDSMKAYFSGYGPSLKSTTTVDPFDNIELYNILSHMLDVTPAPNNGTEGSLYHILRDSPVEVPDSGASQEYLQCDFPQTDQEYEERANDTDCICESSWEEIKEYDNRLDLTESDMTALREEHLPYGIPAFHNSSMCVLHHEDFVSGYDSQLHVPRWTAYTLTPDRINDNLTDINCVRPDVRVETDQQPRCSDFQKDAGYIHNFLFPLAMSSSDKSVMDARLLTNSVAMLPGFATGVWRQMVGLLEDWAAFTLHVISGPVFDYNADGLRDSDKDILERLENSSIPVVIPSHFYFAMMKCPTSDCSNMDYDVQAFVLPHKANITNCMDFEEFIFDNRVRLRDIEILTGLEFITATNDPQGVRTRTNLPVALWDRS